MTLIDYIMEYTPSVCSELVDEIQENRNIFININKKQTIKTLEEFEKK